MQLSISAPPEKLFGELGLSCHAKFKKVPALEGPPSRDEERKLCCCRDPGKLKVEPDLAD